MSLSEIGAVMSRPLVGIEEEPSELELVCLRVREVLCHRTSRLSQSSVFLEPAVGRVVPCTNILSEAVEDRLGTWLSMTQLSPGAGRARDLARRTPYLRYSTALITFISFSQMITRQSDGMSGVAGDVDDSDSDADSDSCVDLEELLPMTELSFSQVSWLSLCRAFIREGCSVYSCELHHTMQVLLSIECMWPNCSRLLCSLQPLCYVLTLQMETPALAARVSSSDNSSSALGAAGDLKGLGHSDPRACDGTRCGQEPMPCKGCEGPSRASALGPVSEDDSWHGVSLLTGALNPGSTVPASGGTSFSREYGLSREHSRGDSSFNTGSSAGATRWAHASCGLTPASSPAIG